MPVSAPTAGTAGAPAQRCNSVFTAAAAAGRVANVYPVRPAAVRHMPAPLRARGAPRRARPASHVVNSLHSTPAPSCRLPRWCVRRARWRWRLLWTVAWSLCGSVRASPAPARHLARSSASVLPLHCSCLAAWSRLTRSCHSSCKPAWRWVGTGLRIHGVGLGPPTRNPIQWGGGEALTPHLTHPRWGSAAQL
jgi:hypothetical protein